MVTNTYHVRIVSAEGDGTFFDFVFQLVDGTEKFFYKLYQISEPRYPQKEAKFINEVGNDPENNLKPTIKFVFKLPKGYNYVAQLVNDNGLEGIEGELTITDTIEAQIVDELAPNDNMAIP